MEIFLQTFMWFKLYYIRLSPVRAGIVERTSHYLYSSASNYVNNQGIIEVEIVDNPVLDVLRNPLVPHQ